MMPEQTHLSKIKKVDSGFALMVAAEYRRRGIATGIMGEAKSHYCRLGVRYHTFFTATNIQAAIRLFEILGMAPLYTSFIEETWALTVARISVRFIDEKTEIAVL